MKNQGFSIKTLLDFFTKTDDYVKVFRAFLTGYQAFMNELKGVKNEDSE